MAFKAKDGSLHTNMSTMKNADMRFGAKKPAMSQADGMGDDDQGGDPQDGAAIEAEHGPAVEIQIHHDHDAGTHKVHAEHPDGHSHDTDHASADEAYKFAADVAGVGAEEPAGGGEEHGMMMGGE